MNLYISIADTAGIFKYPKFRHRKQYLPHSALFLILIAFINTAITNLHFYKNEMYRT